MSNSGSFVPSHDGSSQGDLTPKVMANTDGPDAYQPLPAYREDSAEATRIWLKALHGSDGIEPEPCACGVVTKRHVVSVVLGTPMRECAILLTRAQCPACADQWEAAQLRRSLEKPELLASLRVEYEARLKELTKAVA